MEETKRAKDEKRIGWNNGEEGKKGFDSKPAAALLTAITAAAALLTATAAAAAVVTMSSCVTQRGNSFHLSKLHGLLSRTKKSTIFKYFRHFI